MDKRSPLLAKLVFSARIHVLQVAAAAAKWDGTGSLLFTSSTGMYAAESGVVDEQGEVHAADHSERIAKLAGAEASVLDVGGNVVRLTGLYHANRGPHSFFFKKGEIGKRGDSVLNLIHYDDAASIAVAVRPLALKQLACTPQALDVLASQPSLSAVSAMQNYGVPVCMCVLMLLGSSLVHHSAQAFFTSRSPFACRY